MLSGRFPLSQAYSKPWKSYSEQIQLLIARGLIVRDPEAAATTLSHIKYYRLSGYCLAFEADRHRFVSGTTFEQIIRSYEFDRILRRLIVEAIEWIEVDIRTAVAHEFGRLHGPFGHTLATQFVDPVQHGRWIARLRRHTEASRERFVEHHRWKYSEFPDIPIWSAVELMSMGTLSYLFENMLELDRRPIAQRYGIQPKLLASWLHHLTYVRNVCAHFARLWDRQMAIAPERSPRASWSQVVDNKHLYATLLVIATLLYPIDAIASDVIRWKRTIEEHIKNAISDLPDATKRMGLPAAWNEQAEWKALEREEVR